MTPRLLQVALNGQRRPEEHPAIPTTPAQLAAAAAQCVAAGARAVHVHVRDARGRESLAPDDVARCLTALRSTAPGTPAGVSTGAWILADPEERYRTVAAWTAQPDYASVNFHEAGAERLAELLLSRGAGIEVGLIEPGAVRRLAQSGLAPRCLRLLLEPQEQDLDAALATVAMIERELDAAGIGLPRLLHGLDETAWPLIGVAAARGYDTRIGFEDILTLPDGSPAASNAALVAEARHYEFLDAAIAEAEAGAREGGIPIGSVLVHDRRVLGRGHNRRVQQGSAVLHAEMDALERAGRQPAAVYRASTLYTTLSPCAMCSGAILLYGIPRVIVGEHATFLGEETLLQSRGVAVTVLQDPRCRRLMADFIASHPTLWNEDIGR